MPTFYSDGLILTPRSDRAVAYLKKMARYDLELVEAGHSPIEHRGGFAFVRFLHSHYVDQFRDPKVFRDQISLDVGHVRSVRLRLRLDYLKKLVAQAEANDGWVDMMVPESWSFSRNDQGRFHDLMERVSEWGEDHVGIGFGEFLSKRHEYQKGEE